MDTETEKGALYSTKTSHYACCVPLLVELSWTATCTSDTQARPHIREIKMETEKPTWSLMDYIVHERNGNAISEITWIMKRDGGSAEEE